MALRSVVRLGKGLRGAAGLAAAAALALGPMAGAVETEAPKQKLTMVQRDLEKKRADVARYKRKLDRLEQGLGEDRDRARSARSERRLIEKLRRSAASQRRRLRSSLSAMERQASESLARAGGAADLLYQRTLLASGFEGSSTLWVTAALERAVTYETQSYRLMEDKLQSASRESEEADRKAEELSARSERTRERERDAAVALRSRRRDLEATRRRLDQSQARVKELEASAAELDRLVARLSRRPSTGPLGRHSLPWPAKGEIVARFGRQRVEAFGTWVVHHGIRLATAPGARVLPVRPGRVVYAGPFRSYGEVVILDHGGGFVTVYGHLGKVLKAAGDEVGVQDVIGTAGQSLGAEAQLVKLPEGRGSVYFEIRKGNLAVDPLKWLRRR